MYNIHAIYYHITVREHLNYFDTPTCACWIGEFNMAEEMDDLTNCPVCFEEYSEDDNIPRILPCHCTLCHKCIEKLMKYDGLECPQDRQKHAATSGVKTFPQNKYMLKYLKRRPKMYDSTFDRCKEHGMDMMLFCKHEECQTAICPTCMVEKHSTHPVGNVLENTKSLLMDKISSLMKELNTHCGYLLFAQEQVEKRCSQNIEELEKQKIKVCETLTEKRVGSEEKHKLLHDIKESMGSNLTYKEIKEKFENVQLIESSFLEVGQNVTYNFYELKPKINSVDLPLDDVTCRMYEKTGR